MDTYHYTESGLKNIIINGDFIDCDDQGNEVITIPALGMLHLVIAKGLLMQEGPLDGDEIKFLRTEAGFTQAALAELLHRDPQTVGRWERGDTKIEAITDMVLRQIIAEKLQPERNFITLNTGFETQSKRVGMVVKKSQLTIKHTPEKEEHYSFAS